MNCGWAGPTREGTATPEPTMAGGKGGKVGRYEWMWKAENQGASGKRERTPETRELQAKVYEMRQFGTSNKVIAKIIGRSTSYTKDLYLQYKSEVLGE